MEEEPKKIEFGRLKLTQLLICLMPLESRGHARKHSRLTNTSETCDASMENWTLLDKFLLSYYSLQCLRNRPVTLTTALVLF